MDGGLLDRLARDVGCMISNLSFEPSMRLRLRKIPLEEYTISQWNYSLGYLFAGRYAFASYEEIRRFLKEL